jgi:hypothetical protein
MTMPREIDSQVVPDYVFRRWKRYGHDRLYVSLAGAPEGQQIGYRDLITGGAKGERLVAEQLDKLSRRDERWTAMHAIPVGTRHADIDHLVIGPGGVFSLNTKHHPDADVWVGGDTLMVNGGRVPYVRNSRHEAERATRLLSAAVGRPVPVAGMIVLVGCNLPIKVKTAPRDVHVVTRRKLASWFSGLGPVWSDAELTDIWEAPRRSTTWSG